MTASRFLIAVVFVALLQSFALGAMIYNRVQKLETGTEVKLRSMMRDPRDLFRGHYTRLNLDLGELTYEDTKVIGKLAYKKPVFVELKQGQDGFWQGVALYENLPQDDAVIFIRGNITSIAKNTGQSHRVRLPITRYFAEKKRALSLEKVERDQKLGVILALDGKGFGHIKGLTIDGRTLYEEPLL